ncbi:MAG: hypothetical protein EA362_13990 [Saprospirales bacterium]|nr:MAG: hypothetical protein EA362_13990 [Saprospirales bacterium]
MNVVYLKNPLYLCVMFIKQVKKQRNPNSKIFYQYNLVQSERVDGKVKQRNILYLGSDSILKDKDKRKSVLLILKSKIFKQPLLFPDQATSEVTELAMALYQKYLLKYGEEAEGLPSTPTPEHLANYQRVDIDSIETRQVRSFGPENLCCQIMDKLEMRKIFNSLNFSTDQTSRALIAIAARAIYCSSDHLTSKLLRTNSSLNECLGYDHVITYKELYAITDHLYKFKDQIDKHLYARITDMFELEDKLVIFDLSNTYFETSKTDSKLAQYGKSKERRNDCPVVVFSGVINQDGFIRHSDIYQGNTPDCKTLEQMLNQLDKHSDPGRKKTVVMDAGIATEENLELVKTKGYDYVCVSNKRLKNYSLDNIKTTKRLTGRRKHELELSVFHPEGYSDTWMYVQSEEKRKKEESIRDKISQRFEEQLESIRNSLSKKGGTKKLEKVWERIGRAKEKYKRVSSRYNIEVTESEGNATHIHWERKSDPIKKDKDKGVYFIHIRKPSQPIEDGQQYIQGNRMQTNYSTKDKICSVPLKI